jgi:hypothetical protein
MGIAVRPAITSPGPWDAFADVDVFVHEALAELEAMAQDGARPMRSGPKPPLAGAARCARAVMAIWCFVSVACSGGRSGCCSTCHSVHSMGCSHVGPDSASGAGCSTGYAPRGGAPAGMVRNRVLWSSIVDRRACKVLGSSRCGGSSPGGTWDRPFDMNPPECRPKRRRARRGTAARSTCSSASVIS